MNDFPASTPEPTPPAFDPATPAPPVMAVPPPAAAAPPPVTRDECTLGMLAHILQIFSWLIGPGIIFFVRRDSKFVRYHALQVVFFQLLLMILWLASLIAIFAGAFVAVSRRSEAALTHAFAFPVLVVVILWGGGALTWVLNLVLGIVYGLRANNGEWAGYPGIKYLAAKVAGVELDRV